MQGNATTDGATISSDDRGPEDTGDDRGRAAEAAEQARQLLILLDDLL